MRVTEGMRYSQVLSNLANITSQHAEASQQASSGLRVGKPSDDPIAAAEIARLRASNSQTSTHLSTIDTVRGDAELTESTLADAGDIFVRLKEIALQAATGGLTAEERKTMGVEVGGMKDALLSLANARGTRGYLFSGSQVTTPAFDTTGAFQGDDVAQLVPIGNSSPTAVSTSGSEAFAIPGGRNVFADLDSLATALANNDEASIRSSVDNVDLAHTQLVNARARSGLILNKLDASQTVLTSLDTEQQKRAQAAGAADPVESYTRVTQLGQTLERAIAVSKQLLDVGSANRF
ncbi:MAG TPA: flagellar hook-associated protein FlgL [Polyangiaceae bacterium]|nr:flagellar hook-associated protein FlgL [Polyangiaceae bacterium]